MVCAGGCGPSPCRPLPISRGLEEGSSSLPTSPLQPSVRKTFMSHQDPLSPSLRNTPPPGNALSSLKIYPACPPAHHSGPHGRLGLTSGTWPLEESCPSPSPSLPHTGGSRPRRGGNSTARPPQQHHQRRSHTGTAGHEMCGQHPTFTTDPLHRLSVSRVLKGTF